MIPQENIVEPDLIGKALEKVRSLPGSGGITLVFNPYTLTWTFKISYADGTLFTGTNYNINEAIKQTVEFWEQGKSTYMEKLSK